MIMSDDQLDALPMVAINNMFVHTINNFDAKVIQHFSTLKDGRLHFTYK